jgi:hypothetical protein
MRVCQPEAEPVRVPACGVRRTSVARPVGPSARLVGGALLAVAGAWPVRAGAGRDDASRADPRLDRHVNRESSYVCGTCHGVHSYVACPCVAYDDCERSTHYGSGYRTS